MAPCELADGFPECFGRRDKLTEVFGAEVSIARAGPLLAMSGYCIDLSPWNALALMRCVDRMA